MSTIVSLTPTAPAPTTTALAGCADRGTLVALHCSGSSAAQWRRLSEDAADRFEVRCLDLYGCGQTGGWTGDGPFVLAAEAARVHGLIGDSGAPVHLVGHSYGGAVALHVALGRPERIASLTLYEPTVFHLLRRMSGDAQVAFAEIARVAAVVAEGVLCGDYRSAAAQFVDYWTGGGWAELKPELQAALARWIVKAPLDFRALFEDSTPCSAYAELDCPVLVLRGANAPAPTREVAARLADLIPGARMATVAGAGHMGPITHADDVNRLILAHAGQVANSPRTGSRIAV